MALAERSVTNGGRDGRLDLWRGLALIMIFIDHVPGNAAAALTLKSFGFSDAAEVFVFLAGYAAMLAYGDRADGTARVARRVLKLYGVHLLLVIAVIGLVLINDAVAGSESLAVELRLAPLFAQPWINLANLAALGYMPRFLDILPLYILLLGVLPALLPLIRRHPMATLAGSAGLYAATRLFDLALANGPTGEVWTFNPFAWQLLFVTGLVAADRARRTGRALPDNPRVIRWLDAAAAVILILGVGVAAPWTAVPALRDWTLVDPEFVYGFDKTNLALVRLGHFLALAHAAARLIPRDAAWLDTGWAVVLRGAGRASLPVFSIGLILSIAGLAVLRARGDGFAIQALVNSVGIVTLLAIGPMLSPSWRPRRARGALAIFEGLRRRLGAELAGTSGKAGLARLG